MSLAVEGKGHPSWLGGKNVCIFVLSLRELLCIFTTYTGGVAVPDPDRVGQRVGYYSLVRLLRKGSFADVYLGEHFFRKDDQVTIKVLHTQFDDMEILMRVRTFARLSHPKIIAILSLARTSEDDAPCFIMRYAPGGSLRTRHPKGSRVPLVTVIKYLKEIAPILQYAHDQNILHLNIKPGNILVGQDGELLLGDFDIALWSQPDDIWRHSSINVEGTPYYMAPEQFRGEAEKASDQYALATIVYEWLCGTLPFEGDWGQLDYQHNHQPVPSLRAIVPTLPVRVGQVMMKALAKEPQDRFPSIETFVQVLESASTFAHLFISYARRDQNLYDQLEKHLSNLKYSGLIATWTTREIGAGEEIIQQIDAHLNTAHIILLLISADFLSSDYCYNREMMRAIQRRERGEADVIPILLRSVVFKDAPFAKLQPLPTNRKPVANWRNRDDAFVDIAQGIEHVIQARLDRTEITVPYSEDSLELNPAPDNVQEDVPHTALKVNLIPRIFTSLRRYSNRGLILIGLSLLGMLSAGLLLLQYPNLIPLIGAIVGSLILLAGIFLAIRALVRRAPFKAALRQEQEEIRRREFEEAQRREQKRLYYEKALTAYEQALHQDNADAIAYRGKANALVGLERYSEALTAFEQALQLAPLPSTYVSMGDVFTTLGRHNEAVAAYKQALAMDTSYASAYVGMGKAFSQLGRTQEAEQAYKRAKELDDED
jgi:serine/threonine protein kinase